MAFKCEPTVDYAGNKSVDFGTMNNICQYCSALKFRFEPTGICCANGKVKLPKFTLPHEPLNSLLSGQESLSKHFLQNIQYYKCVFKMTSFVANIIEERRFNPTFKVLFFSVTNIIHIHSNIQSWMWKYIEAHKLISILQIQEQIHHRAWTLLPLVVGDMWKIASKQRACEWVTNWHISRSLLDIGNGRFAVDPSTDLISFSPNFCHFITPKEN